MKEYRNHVVVWAARNKGFETEDMLFFERFRREMSAIAVGFPQNVNDPGATL